MTLNTWIQYCDVSMYTKQALRGWSKDLSMKDVWWMVQDPRVLINIIHTNEKIIVIPNRHFEDKLLDPICWNAIAVGVAYAFSKYHDAKKDRMESFLKKTFVMNYPQHPSAACDLIRSYVECPFDA